MSIATVTSKGQITVPKDVRDDLGLTPGTKVTFTRNADGDYVLSTRGSSVLDLCGALGYSGPAKSLDEMDAAIASAAHEAMQ